MNVNDSSKPADTNDAWRYFRTVTNPRWVKEEEGEDEVGCCGSNKKKYRLAAYEDKNSKQIPICSSTTEQLGIFGIGIGLYFKQIQAFFWLALIYGLILSPATTHFMSDAYNDVNADLSIHNGTVPEMPFLLKASAVCTDYEMVEATVDCDPATQHCMGMHASRCELKQGDGIFDFVAIGIVLVYVIFTSHLQAKQVERLDLAQQTPQDYSVVVEDPDPDADNPDEWKDFFQQFGDVAYITIARKNRKFLKLLAQRRTILHQMFMQGIEVDVEESKSESAGLLQPAKPWCCSGPEKKFRYKLWQINQKINKMKDEVINSEDGMFPVSKVYVIFCEENGQRECLNTLTTGKIPAMFEIGNLDDKYRMKGNVLQVEEPVEPSEVLWHNLELSPYYLFFQGVLSSILTLGIIYLCYLVIVSLKSGSSAKNTGIIISLINVALPSILKIIVLVEKHVDDGDRQDSLFSKLTIARFMNTAIINWVTTPFHDTLSINSLKTVQSILIADAITTPTVSLLDIGGFIKRRVLAKFAKTHPKLLGHFTGTKWYLGERYTSYTKTFFVSLFYATLFPGGMFVAAICFLYGYWVDKFLLLRKWKKPPQYDAQLAKKARGHIMFSVLVHLLVTANWYYAWPFDDVTKTDAGYELVAKAPITPSEPSSWWGFFYMTPQDWQSQAQQFLVLIYSHASQILLVLLFLFYFSKSIWDFIVSLFYGDYDEVGSSMTTKYQDVVSIDVFMPMCFPPKDEMAGPLAAAYCDNVDERHHPEMPEKDFKEQNVANEFQDDESRRLFGIVKGYNTARTAAFRGDVADEENVKGQEGIEMSKRR